MKQTTQNTILLKDIDFGNRYRTEYEGIEDLAQSIKTQGLLSPLVVNEEYKLLAGGRRYHALELLGIENVPVTILEATEEITAREIELIENIMRADMG